MTSLTLLFPTLEGALYVVGEESGSCGEGLVGGLGCEQSLLGPGDELY